jgi:hypothetical protein
MTGDLSFGILLCPYGYQNYLSRLDRRVCGGHPVLRHQEWLLQLRQLPRQRLCPLSNSHRLNLLWMVGGAVRVCLICE